MDNPYDLGQSTPAKGNQAESSPSGANGIQRPMGFANTASPREDGPAIVVVSPEKEEQPMPVWMQRTCLIIYVLFCLEVGLLLTLVPWTQAWNHNTYIFSNASIRSFLQTGFVRGVVTGIGLIDMWLGIWEAVQYRDIRPVPEAK